MTAGVQKRSHILYIYSSFCITRSVGSVTKAKLRCSCDEPSSEAVWYSVSLLLSGYFVVSLSSCLFFSPVCIFGKGGGGFSST